MTDKYELTGNIRVLLGHNLRQIRALKDFGWVNRGDLGGWVESDDNLSQTGLSWVYDNALVFGNARVYGNAEVYGHAIVCDKAIICDHAYIYGHARVYGNSQVGGYSNVYDYARVYGDSDVQGDIFIRENDEIDSDKSYLVFKNTWSSGRYFVYVLSNQRWHVGCFNGTGDELIKKAYKDSELSGKMYELYVNIAEQVVKTQQHNKGLDNV